MKLLASKFNKKKFFLRSQLYARAYVRIWTLRPCNNLDGYLDVWSMQLLGIDFISKHQDLQIDVVV